MIKKYLPKSLLLLLLTLSLSQVGYSNINTYSSTILEINKNKFPTYSPLDSYGTFFVNIDKATRLTEKEFLSNINDFFRFSSHNSFVEIDRFKDANNITHTTYQHFAGKYSVEGQMFIVHSKDGFIQSINGTIINIENKKSKYSLKSTVHQQPTIGVTNAIEIAFAANKIKASSAELKVPTETVFVKASDTEPIFILSHKVRVDDLKMNFISKEVYVSVEDGAIVTEVSLIPHIDAKGDGFYRKNLKFDVSYNNGNYQMFDQSRNLITYDATEAITVSDIYNNQLNPASNSTTSFQKSTNNDVHWGLTKTYDYYKQVHSRSSYDNKEGYIRGYNNPTILHGDPSGFPYNAVALGYPYDIVIFGNGDGRYMNPLTTLDVVGHEFSHLVINYNGRGGLRYQGESGALNESFADIFGSSIEHYSVTDANWTMGEGIQLGETYSYIRNMQNPKENNPQSQQPNTYKGQYWASTGIGSSDSGGVHTNSGVLNYWYYLLTEGGTGINDLGNEYTVFGIGIEKAEKIAYSVLTAYLTANSQYQGAYNGALLATETLYGKESDEYDAVHDAWYAVGFGERRPNMGKRKYDLIENNYVLYPNPITNGEFTVLTRDEKATITFYNMAGQKVSEVFEVGKGETKLQINHLSTGNYIVIYEANGNKSKENMIIR